jgi:hypothetical protein
MQVEAGLGPPFLLPWLHLLVLVLLVLMLVTQLLLMPLVQLMPLPMSLSAQQLGCCGRQKVREAVVTGVFVPTALLLLLLLPRLLLLAQSLLTPLVQQLWLWLSR